MKKLLFTIALISTPIFAGKPLPKACQDFISVSEAFFKEVTEKQPEKAAQAQQLLEMLSGLQKEWDKLQDMKIDQNEDPEKQKIAVTMKQMGEEVFEKMCQNKLQGIQKIIDEAKTEL